MNKFQNSKHSSKTILLFGKNGQIGWELQRTLSCLGKVIALDRNDVDLIQIEKIREVIRRIKPNIIVNAAAYTNVELAESEPDLAMKINSFAPGIMAEEAKRINAAMVHYSTDYVFDGNKKTPYNEDDKANPINTYGKTKLSGEEAIKSVGGKYFIFRTSWVYGLRGNNFLLTMLKLSREKEFINVVDDQVGAPTWCRMIAETTAYVLNQVYLYLQQRENTFEELSGIYHLTARGKTSWYGFAYKILEDQLKDKSHKFNLIGIKTVNFEKKVQRPHNSLLDNHKCCSIFNNNRNTWSSDCRMVLNEVRQIVNLF